MKAFAVASLLFLAAATSLGQHRLNTSFFASASNSGEKEFNSGWIGGGRPDIIGTLADEDTVGQSKSSVTATVSTGYGFIYSILQLQATCDDVNDIGDVVTVPNDYPRPEFQDTLNVLSGESRTPNGTHGLMIVEVNLTGEMSDFALNTHEWIFASFAARLTYDSIGPGSNEAKGTIEAELSSPGLEEPHPAMALASIPCW